MPTYKQNATEISPLDGKPGKKQKEILNKPQHHGTNEEKDSQEEETNTDQSTDKTQNICTDIEQHNRLKLTQNMARNMIQIRYPRRIRNTIGHKKIYSQSRRKA